MKKLNVLMSGIVAAGLITGAANAADSSARYQVLPTSYQNSSDWQSLSSRIQSALSQLAAQTDGAASATLFTSLGVVEYPAQVPGQFDSFSPEQVGHRLPAVRLATSIRLYPTSDTNTAFIEYVIPGQERNGFAFIEMRGDRIARIRDFSTPRSEVNTVAKAQ